MATAHLEVTLLRGGAVCSVEAPTSPEVESDLREMVANTVAAMDGYLTLDTDTGWVVIPSRQVEYVEMVRSGASDG